MCGAIPPPSICVRGLDRENLTLPFYWVSLVSIMLTIRGGRLRNRRSILVRVRDIFLSSLHPEADFRGKATEE
jgi:hypothetical protein